MGNVSPNVKTFKNKEDLQRMLYLYAFGFLSVSDLAKEFNCHNYSIRYQLQRHELIRSKKRQKVPFKKEKSYKQIQKEMEDKELLRLFAKGGFTNYQPVKWKEEELLREKEAHEWEEYEEEE